jgi:hypothetical protein
MVGNGETTRFWKDTWLGDTPLAVQYPSPYDIVYHKNVTIANVMNLIPSNINLDEPYLIVSGIDGGT